MFDPKQLGDLSTFTMVDLAAIWPDEILPLIDQSLALTDLHTACIGNYSAHHPTAGVPEDYTEATYGGAWVFFDDGHFVNGAPCRQDPGYWAPRQSCFWMAPWALALARAWRPDGEWRCIRGQLHATVIGLKERLVFDILQFDGLGANGPNIVRVSLFSETDGARNDYVYSAIRFDL